MFKALRKMILPIVLIALVGFLATIIFQWGMELSSRDDYLASNVAAVINGEEISWQDYNKIYSNLYQQASQGVEDELPDSKIREIQGNAWNQLLHDRLIMQEVAKHNISVTSEELYDLLRFSPPAELQQITFFHTDGRFDYQKYLNYMADPNAAPFWASVEPFIRTEIMKMKLQEMVSQAAQVTEAEIKEAFVTSEEKVKVDMVNVSTARFSQAARDFTDQDVDDYFAANRDKYKVDERAVLKVALIQKQPEPSDWERARVKASEIYDSATAGADFAQLAMTYSDDNSARNGGDLGWFPEGQMVPEFNDMVFSMKKGEISQPVRTTFGYHVILLHDRKEEMGTLPGSTKQEKITKAHASHILFKAAPSAETLDRVFNTLNQIRTEAENSSFEAAAAAADIELRETRPFERGDVIQFIGRDEFANQFAFDKEVGSLSDIMENNSAIYVFQIAERLPSGLADLEESRSQAKRDLMNDRMYALCMDTANAIYADYEQSSDLKKAAKKHAAKYVELDPFARSGYVKDFGRDPYAIGGAFALREPGQVSKPIQHEKGAVIFKLVKRSSPDLTDFTAKRDSIQSVLLVNKQQELYAKWYESLRENSEIINNIQLGRARSDI